MTHVRTYPDRARSRAGASKQGWRLLMLQGCPAFMESLKKFDQDYKFPVGSGHVIIRGGAGRPKIAQAGRILGKNLRQQQHHQDRQQHQQQRPQNPRTSEKSADKQGDDYNLHKSYDRQFPDPGNISAVGRGRGRGDVRSQARNPGWSTVGDSRAPGPSGAQSHAQRP